MVANYVCIKHKSKVFGYKEISYVDVTWYMGSTHSELKTHGCVWLISICIIN